MENDELKFVTAIGARELAENKNILDGGTVNYTDSEILNTIKNPSTTTISMAEYHRLLKDSALIRRLRTVIEDDPTVMQITKRRYAELNGKEDFLKLLEKEGLVSWDGYLRVMAALLTTVTEEINKGK
jgi:hypothetical protein